MIESFVQFNEGKRGKQKKKGGGGGEEKKYSQHTL